MTGIGYRKDFGPAFLETEILKPDFIEVAPENWMGIGGYWRRQLEQVLEKYPLFVHGLSLSLGGPDELDYSFLRQVKKFLHETHAQVYSEHLSFSRCDNAHLYDLLPVPFTKAAVDHVAERIRIVQDLLERKLPVEIVSYYSPVAAEMPEADFINAIVQQADCELLLDVNNVYVNGFNHGYDPQAFIRQLPLNRVRYIHMAGHLQISDTLIIDTHGEAIIDPVYALFEYTMELLGRDLPVLLERDFNILEFPVLQQEMEKLQHIQSRALNKTRYANTVGTV